MGLLFVLMLYAIVFSVLACISSIVLGYITRKLTRLASSGGRRAVVFAIAVPWLCIGIGFLGFVGYAVMNSAVFDRDPGLGDSWHTPIPNGYSLEAIDVTDFGTVFNPKTQRFPDSIGSQEDAVFGVRRLEIDNNLISGTYDGNPTFEKPPTFEDHYFSLDTNTGKRSEFSSLPELETYLAQRGIKAHLRSFWEVFCDYRNTWFDWVTLIIGISVPLIGLAMLIWLIVRARRTAVIPAT